MPCAAGPSLNSLQLPSGFTLVSLEQAARAAGVDERTMRRHCARGDAWAFRIFAGSGPWRVVLDQTGMPADPPEYVRPFRTSAPLPEGFRVTWLKEAAQASQVDERTFRKFCTRGDAWAWRLFSGRGPWRVVLTPYNQPADPPRGQDVPDPLAA